MSATKQSREVKFQDEIWCQKDKDTFLKKWRVWVEMICVGILMVTVWALLFLPIVFYHLPVEIKFPPNSTSVASEGNSNECQNTFPYPNHANDVCRNSLRGILSAKIGCHSAGHAPLVQRNADAVTEILLHGLVFLDSSEDCREAVIPTICSHFFGLCDSSGVSLQPTAGQCREIRDELCVDEWNFALQAKIDLPVCETLPEEQASCSTLQSGSGFEASNTSKVLQSISETLDCRENFFREQEGGLCFPKCEKWQEFSPSEVMATDAIILLSAAVGIIAAVAVIIISIIRYKSMFCFPSIFVIFLTCDIMILEIFIVMTYFDRDSLYCSSSNLLKSIYEVTPFCAISGMVFVYAILQSAIWWLIHTTALLWKIRYPFHARSFQISHKTRYICIACIVSGLLIPLVPIVTTMVDFSIDLQTDKVLQKMNVTFLSGGLGYSQYRFPPLLCSGRNANVVYYSAILPINIIVIVGLTEFIILLWTVHKQHGLFTTKRLKNPFQFSTPEKKILVTLFYYVIVTVVGLSQFTLLMRNAEPFKRQLEAYFACEGQSHDANQPCDRSNFEELTYPIVFCISLALIGLFPAVNLVYALNVQELKEKCCLYRGSKKKQNESTNLSTF